MTVNNLLKFRFSWCRFRLDSKLIALLLTILYCCDHDCGKARRKRKEKTGRRVRAGPANCLDRASGWSCLFIGSFFRACFSAKVTWREHTVRALAESRPGKAQCAAERERGGGGREEKREEKKRYKLSDFSTRRRNLVEWSIWTKTDFEIWIQKWHESFWNGDTMKVILSPPCFNCYYFNVQALNKVYLPTYLPLFLNRERLFVGRCFWEERGREYCCCSCGCRERIGPR